MFIDATERSPQIPYINMLIASWLFVRNANVGFYLDFKSIAISECACNVQGSSGYIT
jgi:hypothetical protein